MAYYHGSFINREGAEIEVRILTGRDRTEQVEIGGDRLMFAEDAVELSSSFNDSTDHVISMSASVRLLARDYVPDLFQADFRNAAVNVTRDGSCVFAGYVTPQTYSQGYNEVYDELELNCIDALSALQYMKFLNTETEEAWQEAARRAETLTLERMVFGGPDSLLGTLDVDGGHRVRYLYDGSVSPGASYDRYGVFGTVRVSSLLFLGEEHDDADDWRTAAEEALRYLNLHICQRGFDFYVYSWETLRKGGDIQWRDLRTGDIVKQTVTRYDLNNSIAADTDTEIDVGECFNRIRLKCDVQTKEELISSPLDPDLLTSPYSREQLYCSMWWADGWGNDAAISFFGWLHGKFVQEKITKLGGRQDWYLRLKEHPDWRFYVNGQPLGPADGVTHQEAVPRKLSEGIGAYLMAFGCRQFDASDTSPLPELPMDNYMVVNVGGRRAWEITPNDPAFPHAADIAAGIPVAEYTGADSGAALLPADDRTTNYIVVSGSVILNPQMYTPLFGIVASLKSSDEVRLLLGDGRGQVYSRNNKHGRYYARAFYDCDTPESKPTIYIRDNDINDPAAYHGGVSPFTGDGERGFKNEKSYAGLDRMEKIPVLALQIVVGDKVCVERMDPDRAHGSVPMGNVEDFSWVEYKERGTVSDTEWASQCVYVGPNLKADQYLLGEELDLCNNIKFTLGLKGEKGMAIPVRKSDGLSGKVSVRVLGPVDVALSNDGWWQVARGSSAGFSWMDAGDVDAKKRLLTYVNDILLKDFSIKVASDNGFADVDDNSDLCYVSDTDESYINQCDDIEFRIHSGLTSEETAAMKFSVSGSVSVARMPGGDPVLEVYDHNRGVSAKPEQLYVDSYYQELHRPRVVMSQKVRDLGTSDLLFSHFYSPAMRKTFFVRSFDRDLATGETTLNLKEIW